MASIKVLNKFTESMYPNGAARN